MTGAVDELARRAVWGGPGYVGSRFHGNDGGAVGLGEWAFRGLGADTGVVFLEDPVSLADLEGGVFVGESIGVVVRVRAYLDPLWV